jgi:CRISPR-associated protein Cas5d
MREVQHMLELWGELACFSSPVSKAERFSYPCPTPSAARGIFDAIFCKPPEFRWQIDRIEILAPIRHIALRRNEVKEVISERAVRTWMSGEAEPEPIVADGDKALLGTDQKGRTQRQTMALKNPHYRITAHIQPWPGMEKKQPALDAQFRRRAARGSCWSQPVFGCREFPAFFRLVEDCEDLPPPAPVDMEIGWMLYDVFDLSCPGTSKSKPFVSVFHAVLEKGVLHIPPYEDAAVQTPAPEGQP